MAADGQIIIDTQIDTSGLVKGTNELEAACKRAAASVSNIGDKAQNSVQKSVNALTKQNQAYRTQEKKVEDIKKQLSESTGQTVMTDEFRALNDEATSLSNKLAQLDEKKRKFVSTGGDEGSKTFRNMEYDADRLIEQLDRVKAKMDELKASGGAYTTADTTVLQSNLAKEQQKLAEMGDRLSTSYSDFAIKINKYGSAASGAAGHTSKFSAAVSKLGTAMSTVWTAAKKVASVIGPAFKKALSTVASLAKKAGSAMLGMSRNSSRANNGLRGGIMTMLKYGFGIRSLYVLVNKLRNALVTGMGNLAQYSNSANNSISAMQSAIARLQNSIAAAFGPILSTVAPIVTELINLLADAISYIGAFFAALSGQKTYTRAIRVQKNFAGSLNNTAGAADNAAGAMKDYLSGLDEIRKFDEGSGSGGGGGGGGGSGSTGPMFETAEIPGLATDWADKFKEAWENADFTEIGTIVGTKLKNALEDIPWEEIQNTCNKIAKSVATFINGFVATPGLWETVGSTIGNGINTAVGMYNTFMDTVNFEKIGNSIATMLGSAIKTTKWDQVGKALTQHMRAAIDTLYGFVTTFPWSEFGTALATALNSAIENIPAGRFGSAVAGLVNGLVDSLKSFIANASWGKASDKIADFLNNAISGVKWGELGSTLGLLAKKLVNEITDAVKKTNWRELGNGIGDMINGVMLEFNTEDMTGAMRSVGNAILDFFFGALESVDWILLAAHVADLFKDMMFGGIETALNWVGEKLNVDFLANFKLPDFSDIYLKLKGVGEESGNSFLDGLKTGGGNGDLSTKLGIIVADATSKFDSFPTSTSEKSKKAYSNALSEWNGAKNDYTNISKNVSNGFDSLGMNVAKNFKNAYKDSKSTWKNSKSDFSKTSTNVSSAFNKLPDSTQKYFSKAYTSSKNAWSNAPSYFKTIANSCSTAFNSIPSSISSSFTKALTAAKSAWSGASSAFHSISANVISGFAGLEAGVKIKFTSAYTAAKNAWNGAKSDFNGIATNIANAFNGISSKITNYFNTAVSGIKNLGWKSAGATAAQAVVNGMYSANPSAWCNWFVKKINLPAGNIGYYLTVGIINGMYTTSGLGNWASWFTNKVKRSLGIHSPSKLFRDEVGYYLGAGISVGLEDSTSKILKTVSGMADKIADRFQDGFSDVALPTLTASSIFPDVTLRTPLLATGTVIPPKATYSSAGSERVSDVLEQLKGLLDKWDRPDGGGASAAGGVIHNVVQINRRTIYEEMKKEEDLVRSQSGM